VICPLCLAVTRTAELSIEAARHLTAGWHPSEIKELVNDLAEAHRSAVQLAKLDASDQLDNFGAVHARSAPCPS
jgi:hypothetical protein